MDETWDITRFKYWLAILGILAFVACGYGAYELYKWGDSYPVVIDAPLNILTPYDENIEILMAIDHASYKEKSRHRDVEVPYGNIEAFKKHMYNIALQNGWYVGESSWYKTINIILPKQDLYMLDNLEKSGVDWVKQNISNTKPSRGPSNLDLVYSGIEIDETNTGRFWGSIFSVIVLIIIMFFLLVSVLSLLFTKEIKI